MELSSWQHVVMTNSRLLGATIRKTRLCIIDNDYWHVQAASCQQARCVDGNRFLSSKGLQPIMGGPAGWGRSQGAAGLYNEGNPCHLRTAPCSASQIIVQCHHHAQNPPGHSLVCGRRARLHEAPWALKGRCHRLQK